MALLLATIKLITFAEFLHVDNKTYVRKLACTVHTHNMPFMINAHVSLFCLQLNNVATGDLPSTYTSTSTSTSTSAQR